ncbi:hypothetical protein N0V84_007160 [Fusarium piperis]|uniref:Cadmium resistance transporter n=1 Tax=Fusarium piperis TaxID=1435070 RepID=A0A9W9BLZ5_9HYPO|nr:hypothetical protein N0V84_007160 [Fusarium piperis]
MFVLVTFFAEATTSQTLTPLNIVIGQYVGFTIIVGVSMIGFGASLLLPTQPIGFLGLLPILLGVWWLFAIIFPSGEEETEDSPGDKVSTAAGLKSIFKVSAITIMNGADNISTYVPLFSQAEGAEIAVYVVVYYIFLGLWCLIAFLIMKQKHILRVAQRYARVVVPFLYMGLGVFIIVKSECYPWSIEHIDDEHASHPGKTIMAVVTTFLLLACFGTMLWVKLRNKAAQPSLNDGDSDTRINSASQQECLEQQPTRDVGSGVDQGMKNAVNVTTENDTAGETDAPQQNCSTGGGGASAGGSGRTNAPTAIESAR